MMEITTLALFLQSAICLCALAAVLLKFWAEARLDSFRQEMFALRDELFDYAASGKVGFDEPAYRLLRRSMNGFIRYAHQLTFFRLCITIIEIKLAGKPTETKWTDDWEKALNRVTDEDTRSALKKFHDRAMVCAAKRLIFGSPMLLSLVLLSFPVLAIRQGWQNLRQLPDKASFFTVSHVFDTSIIENQAAAAAAA